VNGFNISRQAADVRRSIGIVFQDPSVDISLTGRENLRLHAALYDVPVAEVKKRINEVLELVGLTDRADSRMKTYSGGMRRRLELARGLLHSPKILFLDEPTLGLDPQTREHIWTYIEDLVKRVKITIVLTTHYMEEAEKLCTRVNIIDYGKAKVSGSPEELRSTLGGNVVTEITADPAKLAAKLTESGLTPIRDATKNTLRLTVAEADKLVPRVVEIAKDVGVRVDSISVHRPTLNDVFLHYTGHEIRTEEAETVMKTFMRSMRRR
jgi:ABC-2 type transport system ATP-binding protein